MKPRVPSLTTREMIAALKAKFPGNNNGSWWRLSKKKLRQYYEDEILAPKWKPIVCTDFPNTKDIIAFADEYTALWGDWMEDEWYSLGEKWDLNIWTTEGKRKLTVYPVDLNQTDHSKGISLDLE